MRNSTVRLSEKRYLHHCSFRSEKNQRTWDKLITLMKKVCCQLSAFSHKQVRGDPYTNLVRAKNEYQVAKWRTKESGFERQKEQILAEVRTEIQKHEFQADSDRRSIQELTRIIESQRREIDHTIASDEHSDEINFFFKNNYQNKIGIFVKLISKVFMRWKNWREFKSYESMNLRDEDWSKIRTLLMNSRPECRNYRMKSIVWLIRKTLKMLNQNAVDTPKLPVNLRFFAPFQNPGGMLSRSLGMPSRNDKPSDIWNTHSFSGNVCVNPPASSSSPNPGGFNPWIF